MVMDVKQTRRLLKQYFRVKGSVDVDAQTHMVNVHGDVAAKQQMKEFPVKFGHVTGNFDCSWNNLITLAGAPHIVDGEFKCNNMQLTSLKHAPTKVGGSFNCGNNQIRSLADAPAQVGGDYICSGNQLTSLQGCPSTITGGFYCRWNFLNNLEGAPTHVQGDFFCDYNPELKSLEGLPSTITGRIVFSYNIHSPLPLLRVLIPTCTQIECEGAPQKVRIILNKYRGQGKAGAIKAAAELIGAGFKENAKW